MTQPGYPAARAAAARIRAHFERRLAALPPPQARKAALPPDTTAIEAIIEAAFWASLRREERSEEHTSELQSRLHLVCRLLLEKKKKKTYQINTANATELIA